MRHVIATIVAVVVIVRPELGRAETVKEKNILIEGHDEEWKDSVIHLKKGTRIRVVPPATLTITATRMLVTEEDVVIDASRTDRPAAPAAAPARTDDWVSSTPSSLVLSENPPGPNEDPATVEWRLRADETDRGNPGARGLPGLPGGTVRISAKEFAQGSKPPIVNVSGGPGGPGGKGGAGRILRDSATPNIKQGPDGPDGPDGPPGPPGTYELRLNGVPVSTEKLVVLPTIDVTLTLSGGVSLGAYEAGYNWALVRILRQNRHFHDIDIAPMRLAAVTGASAGAINTFLTAIAWCLADESSDPRTKEKLDAEARPDQNVFWRTWVPIGLTRLFPGTKTCADYEDDTRDPQLDCRGRTGVYLPDDGLFTRQAFREVEASISSYLADRSLYLEGCSVPIGIPVTRVQPTTYRFQKLEVPSDRYVIVLRAKAGGNGLELSDVSPAKEDQSVGRYLHPKPDADGGLLSPAKALKLVEASSAFPLAFGPVQLEDPDAPGTDSKAAFIDGGLFDNVPIGLALSILRKSPFDEQGRTDSVVHVHSIDSDRRRNAVVLDTPGGEEDPSRGLSVVPTLLTNFVSVSRKYELQALARYALDDLISRRNPGGRTTETGDDAGSSAQRSQLVFSSRYYPIFGDYLAAFGAFLSYDFRRHDYYVGLYDALYDFALGRCQSRVDARKSNEELATCIIREVFGLHQSLRLEGDSSYVVRHLLGRELESQTGAAQALRGLELSKQLVAAAWLDAPVEHDPAIAALLVENDAIQDDTAKVYRNRKENPKDLRDFKQRDHLAWLLTDLEQRHQTVKLEIPTAGSPDQDGRWLLPIVTGLLGRLRDLDIADHYGTGVALGSAGDMGLRTYGGLRPTGLELEPSTVPEGFPTWGRLVSHFLPYSFGVAPDLFTLGYRPRFTYWRFAVEAPLNAVAPRDRDGFWGGGAGIGLSFRTGWFSVSSFDLDAGAFAGDGILVRRSQATLSATFAGGKLRAGWQEYRDHDTRHVRGGPLLAIEDLNGLLYWLGASVRQGFAHGTEKTPAAGQPPPGPPSGGELQAGEGPR